MPRTRTSTDLLEAFRREGCPVCRIVLATVRSYLDSISHEGGITDPEIRDRIRAAHGFCHTHAYQWLEQQHVLGTAIIYDDVLGHVACELQSLRFKSRGLLPGAASLRGVFGGNSPGGDGRLDTLRPHQECLACRSASNAEQAAVHALLTHFREQDFRQAYERSDGLCLPHLREALSAVRDEGSFDGLVQAALSHHEALRKQLQEVIRHHDYRFSGEPAGDERGSGTRAVRHVVGEAGVRGLAPSRGGPGTKR